MYLRSCCFLYMEIPFRPITLNARSEIMCYTLSGPYRNCDFAFANMYSWQFLYRSEYAVVEDTLFIRFYLDGRRPAYMIPRGTRPLRESIALLRADASALGHTLCLLGISEEGRAAIDDACPGEFRFVVERDYADYIYLREELAALSGKRFQPKRNHINQFLKKYPDYRYLPLTSELVAECLRFEDEWLASQSGSGEDLSFERQAITRALTRFDDLELSGGTLWVGGRLVAFTYGSPITDDTFGVHVEKADASFEGAYAMINREFARTLPAAYRYVNREEDLGIPGLRQAKLSYHPFRLQEKMAAICWHARQGTPPEPLPLEARVADGSAPLSLRRATDADRPAVMDLWQTCFHDDPRFLRLFFDRKFSPERSYLVVRGDKLCSALHHLPYMLSLWGGEEPLSYWAGLSTVPEERGRGLMATLMTHAFSLLGRRGFPLVALIPAEASLYDYYARFGFETTFFCRHYRYVVDGEPSCNGVGLTAAGHDMVQLSRDWACLTAATPCRVLHDADDFAVICADARLAGGEVWQAMRPDATLCALAVAVPRGAALHLLEVCALDAPSLAQMLMALAVGYGVREISFSLPEGAGVEASLAGLLPGLVCESAGRCPSGMVRIVDAGRLLDSYATAYPGRSFTLRLRDELLPSNAGVYTIKEGRSCKQPLSVARDTVCDYDFDIRALARWLLVEGVTPAPCLSLMLSE